MKRNFIISAILLSLLVSCTHNPQPSNNITETSKLGDFRVKVIDDCEYLEYEGGFSETSVYSLTHKGNCKNCHINLLQALRDVFLTFK